ncbi:MAG: SpoIVB peptidase [Clostridium sp.]|uniref:SpoIVB peptidase n=1 Tax=Clostridium paraputrificum TaxID=29363 RepID=A0A6N3DPC2_9CLOT|nr:SpoIVB peptidase [Clostridium sp.]MBS5927560.1 SpoIVB peptidase [Clostridium sp.]MBS5987299.1 SpoIVB peptidase [Clostridium sp.]
MNKKLLKIVSVIIAPILILALSTCIMLKDVPDHLYTSSEVEVMSALPNVGPFNKVEYKEEKLKINLLGLIPMKQVSVHKVKNIEVIPGGNCIGVRLSSKGVLVVGFSEIAIANDRKISPAGEAGIEVGDVILKIDGDAIETSQDLIKKVSSINKEKINIELLRDGKNLNKEVTLVKEGNSGYKLGLWVRDSTAGVGTMTFYDEKTGKFAALGHPVTDGDTNKPFTIKKGDLLQSSIISVRKGEKGAPGELKGIFVNDDKPIGNIVKNTQCGIFGEGKKAECNPMRSSPMKVAFRDEIKLGKATIITTIDEEGPKEYEIEIVKLLQQDSPGPKSMLIKVTDETLLSKTGGIVQGMSGSPIIQNGKLVGAVTHVLINKPDVGYGIYIDWMLEDAGILK